MNDVKNSCRCIVRHANTAAERKQVVDDLNYSRSIGDTIGIMMAMARLSDCQSNSVQS